MPPGDEGVAPAAMARRRRALAGKVAIVTGGSAGIGLATSLLLARAGARVALVARDETRLAAARSKLLAQSDFSPEAVLTLSLDLRNAEDAGRMAAATLERWERIDILVHSAGILRPPGSRLRRCDETRVEDWDLVIDTNLKGTFLANRAVLPHMIERRRGDILNLSSKSGRRGLAFDAPYCASKFGVIGLTEAIAEEVRSFGVRVQTLLPGTFDTGIWVQAGPLGRPLGLPPATRVAQAILWMLTLPPDACVWSPLVEPLVSEAESGWRRGTPAS
jgi:NAD(P)-dependent dehydrogenase (short-subunit alcohol dehydrogenase family)